jgi:hypothetical protein
MRTERLHVEVGYVPLEKTYASRAYQLATGNTAAKRALQGKAEEAPLIRDDTGRVLVGRAKITGPTYIPERKEVPCDYGTVTPAVSSRNPFVLNFMPWVGLFKDVRSARSLTEAWMYVFGPPGWRPDGEGLTTADIRRKAGLVVNRSAQPVMT